MSLWPLWTQTVRSSSTNAPALCGRGHPILSVEVLMPDQVRIAALQTELRTSTSAERRAHILAQLAQLGVMQRADAPTKETR